MHDSEDVCLYDATAKQSLNSRARILGEAGDIVNDLIHDEIAKQSSEQIYVHEDPNEMNIDHTISAINPDLWTFLESATRTIRERKSCSMDLRNAHTKKLRRFFGLCTLMYCTNSQKPSMLHVILADIVEMCGGSRNLIKILNQLGAVASADTHDRFVTSVLEKQREKCIWESLPENTFSIASVDNFDMLQSHAAVYCGDQKRSYHGTTIQVVQPDPLLPLPCKSPIVMSTPNGDHQTHVTTQCKRKFSHSPASSPHKLGKVGPKRPRTLVTRNLTQCMVQTRSALPESQNAVRELALEGFLEQPEEKEERKDFESKLFSYMFARHKLPARLVLKDFKTLYSESKCKR